MKAIATAKQNLFFGLDFMENYPPAGNVIIEMLYIFNL